MKAGWQQVRLGDIASVRHGYAFDGEYFVEEKTTDVLVTPGNFAIGGGFKIDKLKHYRGPVPSEFILNPGDLVVTMTDLSKASDTLGYSAMIPDVEGIRFLHNQRIGRILIKNPEIAKSKYLHWLLRTDKYRHEILAGASGSTVKHTAPSRIEAYKFQLPTIDEQSAIAEILDVLDQKIELNRKTNETLEEMTQFLFKSWFVDFDPVHAKAEGRMPSGMDAATAKLFPHEFQHSELGKIPRGWATQPLYDIAAYINGAAYSAFQPNNDRRGLPRVWL